MNEQTKGFFVVEKSPGVFVVRLDGNDNIQRIPLGGWVIQMLRGLEGNPLITIPHPVGVDGQIYPHPDGVLYKDGSVISSPDTKIYTLENWKQMALDIYAMSEEVYGTSHLSEFEQARETKLRERCTLSEEGVNRRAELRRQRIHEYRETKEDISMGLNI